MLSEPLLTPRQVADRFGLTPAQLKRLRRHGRGPSYVRLDGDRVRYSPVAIACYIEGRTFTPRDTPVGRLKGEAIV